MVTENSFDNLKSLLEKIKNISLFERIFKWGTIMKQFIIGLAEFDRFSFYINSQATKINELQSDARLLTNKLENLEVRYTADHDELVELRTKESLLLNELSGKKSDLAGKESTITALKSENEKYNNDYSILKQKYEALQQSFDSVKEERNKMYQTEEERSSSYQHAMNTFSKMNDKIQAEKESSINLAHQNELKKIAELKDTWSKHQLNVKNKIKLLAQKHTIEYVETVPFKGDPDNTLKICDEFVIFDAKSPGSDDLTNFPIYLKNQAEAAKKYATKENVKADIYFVVPTNTLERLEVFTYKFGDHNVYILSIDSIEPVIIALQQIENYEFAEQLAPEDREDICRIIGRFAHLSKRRIQVDNYFAKHSIELAYKCENELPDDILKMVLEFEKSEKLNPPLEKRAKNIPTLDLDKNNKKLKSEAEARGILIENNSISVMIDEIPLFINETANQ